MILRALLACHNRRVKTLACLKSFRDQKGLKRSVTKKVTLFDDGSTDGTSDWVSKNKLADEIFIGDGNFYWCGAMRRLCVGLKDFDSDLILLLNDDVVLKPRAVKALLEVRDWALSKNTKEPIVVGATQSIDSHNTTYGGLVKYSFWRPLGLKLLNPNGSYLPCDTFNCNCVLLSRKTISDLGGFDNNFTHSMGDIDLGLRARKSGVPIWLAPQYVGYCNNNKPADRKKTFLGRWKALNHPKGAPPLETFLLYKRHGGVAWPFYWAAFIVRKLIL